MLITKTHCFISLFIFSFFVSCISNPPMWIEKRPIENQFWHGIGYASKKDESFMDIARERAMNEIASQIKINIKSELDLVVKDYNGSVENTISSISKSRVNLLLPELEVVNTYETKTGIYYYMRLNKASYKSAMERLKENAISSALSYLREAEDNFSINSIVNIQKAYNEIVAFNDEPINVSYQGAKKNLYDLIKTKSNEFHERININTSINNKLITLLNENNVISFEVTDNIEKNKLSSVPIMLNFDASEQKLITDENGIATYRIPRIIDPKTINIFFKLDLETLINKISSESGPFFDHSKEFSTSFEFKKARAIIRSEEKNLNKLLKNKIIEPTIKSVLSNNIDFVVENADILILIRSNTMKKAERLGENYPYFAYGNISISIQNLADGNLFFNTSHSNIKGADFSALEIAGIRSYDALSEIIVNELKNQLIYGNE